jgi:hypothetical protein
LLLEALLASADVARRLEDVKGSLRHQAGEVLEGREVVHQELLEAEAVTLVVLEPSHELGMTDQVDAVRKVAGMVVEQAHVPAVDHLVLGGVFHHEEILANTQQK